jgi:tight adherence protein C
VILLSLIALLLLGGSLALVLRAIALPRMKVSSTLQSLDHYGFDSVRKSLSPEAPDAPAFSELASAIGRVLARRLRGVRPEELRREILAAGFYKLTPMALIGYRFLGFVIVGLLGIAVASDKPPVLAFLIVIVTAAIGWVAPLVFVRRRARFRMHRIERKLPDLIDLLVVTVEAGMGLGASLQLAAGKMDGPLADELRLTMQEQRMGRSLADALSNLLVRADTPGMRSFVRSVVQGESLGVSIGQIMRNLAEEMRKRRRKNAEEQAQKAPVKMLFPLVFLIFPAIGVVILGPAVINIVDTLGGGL